MIARHMVDVEPVKPAPKLQVLQSRTLAEIPFVAHGLTRRVAGLGAAEGNVAYGGGRDRDEAWEMRRAWCNAIELDAETLVTVHQVHGVEVAAAAREDAGRGAVPGSSPLATADAIISAESGVALMTLHADCLPILLCAPDVPAIAAVHAGWRGTVAGVTARTVEALKREYGAVPDRTIAYLGPTNRGCCYEVGSEVVEGWLDYDPEDRAVALSQRGDRWYFDVALANRSALLAHGFRPGNIETSGICTQCASDQWFSHRAQGPDTGRFGAIIALR